MKRLVGFLLVLVTLAVGVTEVEGGLVFGVRPAFLINGAYGGYSTEKWIFLGGIDFVRYSEGNNFTDLTDPTYSYSSKTSVMVFIPQVGVKYFLGESPVRPYLFGTLFQTFAFASAEVNGTGDPNEEEYLKDLYGGIWGLNTAFGSEYFFDPRFSVGGEFGLRTFLTKTEDRTSFYVDEDRFSLGLTYTVVGFQFYY